MSDAALTIAFWECGRVEVETDETHECDGRELCRPTYRDYAPASAIIDAITAKSEADTALRNARTAIEHARGLLTPGMKAGVGEAKLVLRTAVERIDEALA